MFALTGCSSERVCSLALVGTACRWTTFAENVTTTVNKILATKVPLQGAAFAESSHADTTGFSPQAIFQNNILSSSAGSQIKLYVMMVVADPCNRSTLCAWH